MASEKRERASDLRSFAIAALASHGEGDEPELAYLRRFSAKASELKGYLRSPAPQDEPLLKLSAAIHLSTAEIFAISLAAAVEDDALLGRGLARLQSPLGGSRPTAGLLAKALEVPIEQLVDGPAFHTGALQFASETAPVAERSVFTPMAVALALKNRDGSWPGATVGSPEQAIPLAKSAIDQARHHADALRSGSHRSLIIRSGSIEEARSAATAVAAALDKRPVFLTGTQVQGLVPWLVLRDLVPVFSFSSGPGERNVIPALPGWEGPVLAICGPDGFIDMPGGTALNWRLKVPPEDERRDLWRIALGDEALASRLAREHRHTSGRIAQLAAVARHRSSVRARTAPGLDDLASAAWNGHGNGLDSLSQPLTSAIPDEALVISPALRNELDILLLRCRSRDRLERNLGASVTARYSPGVRALFLGPSGTGKTLAAGWLATKLQLPLYRVDLASVTSKYIGETEKNLAQMLALAEEMEVVLLFDEADSLFAKRTDVREANDRFANAQTNYLLQRIESYDGIVLLTSNSRARFDSGFSRRLDAILDFPLPGPEERRALWLSHLGPAHALAPRDLNQLAAVADLAGGHIRNVVLTAAVLAGDGGRPIEFRDLLHGLTMEYRKLGRQMPADLKAGV